jgi:hypothetical protein
MTTLRAAIAKRVVVADGAIGTMLQASDATVDDFAGHEGYNEIRPDILAGIDQAYPQAGPECLKLIIEVRSVPVAMPEPGPDTTVVPSDKGSLKVL